MHSNAIPETSPRSVPGPLKPMGWGETLLSFGLPTLLFLFTIYVLWPWLRTLGVNDGDGRTIAGLVVTASLAVAALVRYRLEGNPWTWAAFRDRMRLGRMGKREWLWTLGCFLVYSVLGIAVSIGLMAVLTAINFVEPIDIAPEGGSAVLGVISMASNIIGEELWWRGYIQPRQEMRFGRWTFVVQGVLWGTFHAFKWWVVPAMMITGLVMPYVAQKTKSTWPSFITHLVTNVASDLLPLILALFGVA